MTEKQALEAAIAAVGSGYRLAQLLDITPTAIYNWERCPDRRVLELERLSGVSRHDLRPDLYPREKADA